ncbi:MAG TPA: tRNA-dependent cyclodipeptide synthase, partial [Gemmataceae bacterium]|nr:tRNA-dependent cyclodipeptide synthase [Gemmataceae bacterium]
MPFQVVRASRVGREINEAEKEHSSKAGCLFGISRGNRYFSREVLEALITTGLEQRKRVVLMLPDVPAVSTLMALGYCLTDAERRSRLDFNSMQHRIGRVLEALTPSQRQLVRVLRWKDLEDLPR